jgi:hypothetical protein
VIWESVKRNEMPSPLMPAFLYMTYEAAEQHEW